MHRILQTFIDRLLESTDVQALRAGTASAREAPFGWRNQLIVAHRVAIGWLCNREPWIVPVGGRWSTKANLRIPLFAAELRPSSCSIGDMRKRRLTMADRRPRHCCLGSPNSAFASARLGARLAL